MCRKIVISTGLVIVLLLTQVGIVLAAPATQESEPISGTVQSIDITTDPTTGETTVAVTVQDELGAIQTVNLSVEEAASLGLVTIDPVTSEPSVNEAAIGSEVTVDPGDGEEDEAQHPIVSVLVEFFGDEYLDPIMAAREEGTGFGVIAQALWLNNQLEGDADMFELIVEAKRSGDYSGIDMPDGSTPQNWGEFKKALRDKGENLGAVKSGHAPPLDEATAEEDPTLQGQGNGQGNSQGNGQQNNNDKGKKGNSSNGKAKGKNK